MLGSRNTVRTRSVRTHKEEGDTQEVPVEQPQRPRSRAEARPLGCTRSTRSLYLDVTERKGKMLKALAGTRGLPDYSIIMDDRKKGLGCWG